METHATNKRPFPNTAFNNYEASFFLIVISISANNYLSVSATYNGGKINSEKLLVSLERREIF